MNINHLLPTAFVITALLLANTAVALPDDNQQPINIQSDKATQQTLEDGEKTEYFGNVVMTQGSLLINADHVVIFSKDRKVTRISANGLPARFQQQSDPNKPPVKAMAKNIDYQLLTETAILTDDATIEQPDAVVSGNKIEYNVATEQVVAQDRVIMTFQPTVIDNSSSTDSNNTDNEHPES